MILKDRFVFILGDPVWKICCVLDLLIASRTAPVPLGPIRATFSAGWIDSAGTCSRRPSSC